MPASPRFEDTTVLVTGAAGALGSELVRGFAAEGARVAATARDLADAGVLADELGADRVLPVALDVTRAEQWAAAVATAEERFGPVGVLVNNAARLIPGTTESLTEEQLEAVIATNVFGAWHGVRAVAPSMRRRGGGSIVNVNSIAGLRAAPGLMAYSTSKWALRGLTRAAAAELAPDAIRVNAIHPGIIDTPLARDPDTGAELVPVDRHAIPRMASSAEIARYVLFLASGEAAFSTGTELVADGGFLLGPVEHAAA